MLYAAKRTPTLEKEWRKLGYWSKVTMFDKVMSHVIGVALFAPPPRGSHAGRIGPKLAFNIQRYWETRANQVKFGVLLAPMYYTPPRESTPGLVWYYSAAKDYYIPVQEYIVDFVNNRFPIIKIYQSRDGGYLYAITKEKGLAPFPSGLVGVIRGYTIASTAMHM